MPVFLRREEMKLPSGVGCVITVNKSTNIFLVFFLLPPLAKSREIFGFGLELVVCFTSHPPVTVTGSWRKKKQFERGELYFMVQRSQAMAAWPHLCGSEMALLILMRSV